MAKLNDGIAARSNPPRTNPVGEPPTRTIPVHRKPHIQPGKIAGSGSYQEGYKGPAYRKGG